MYRSTKGFTMVELVFSILILSTVLIYVLRAFTPATSFSADSRSLNNINFYLQDQAEYIKSRGFWVWSGDTSNANNNSAHPIEIWKTRLAELGYTGRAQMDTVFLKNSNNSLVAFTSNGAFDGDEPRNKVQVTLTLYTNQDQPITETFYLVSTPSQEKCWAALYTIKRALHMYAVDNNDVYPATGDLGIALVSNYLDEIPNDPFTAELSKSTHREELVDWSYTNNSGTITLAAYSHLTTITETF